MSPTFRDKYLKTVTLGAIWKALQFSIFEHIIYIFEIHATSAFKNKTIKNHNYPVACWFLKY